jgi:CBS domain containing-hemolysin-like protein
MSNHQSSLANSDRGESGSSWFNRLAANLGFSGSADARSVIEEALREDDGNIFTPRERAMLTRVLQFKDLRLEDVMVPRVDVIAIDESASMAEVLALIAREGHSRIPVYRDTLDEPLGMVHVKDVLAWLTGARENGGASGVDLSQVDLATTIGAACIIRDVIFAPASMSALDLLVRMQNRHIHLALIIDEYGGTDGLVSIEDLLEEVVGNIEDEHDSSNAPMITEEGDGYIADARADIEEVERRIGHALAGRNDEDIDTIGGLIFSMLGRVPKAGEVIGHRAGYIFEILDADGRRIKRVRIKPGKPPQQPAAGADGAVMMAFK